MSVEEHRNEESWLERLALPPVEPPYARAVADTAEAQAAVPVDAVASLDEADLVAAFAAWLSRMTNAARFSLALSTPEIRAARPSGAVASDRLPLLCEPAGDEPFTAFRGRIADEVAKAVGTAAEAYALMAGLPEFHEPRYLCAVRIVERSADRAPSASALELVLCREPRQVNLAYDRRAFDDERAARLAALLGSWLAAIAAAPATSLARLPLVGDDERRRLLLGFNDSACPFPRESCVHELFDAQVARTPDAVAVVFGDVSVSYRELAARANRLAHHLMAAGAAPDQPVGLCLERGVDLVAATLAVLKSGAAYLPLDPAYPTDRLALMIEDSGAPLIIAQRATLDRLPRGKARIIELGAIAADLANRSTEPPANRATPESLAYTIYTSGSTGKPKGVLIEHRNVVNFFTGMDAHISARDGQSWLAVTSLSFDISVLELLWTLCRGFKVVVAGEDRSNLETRRSSPHAAKPIDFSLFYFAADETAEGDDRYRLLLEGAKFADRNGFVAVWTPERHFGAFGGLYPSPSVAGAALAMITERVSIRAGSCVAPLHHPARIAEEWALVDNLSKGRVGVSFASGWHPTDFLLRPETFADKKGAMASTIDAVRRLWRGDAVRFESPTGPVEVRTRPRPIQKELPFWVTAAGNPATFEAAGQMGANLLTHLLGQSLEEVAQKLKVYRDAWQKAGHPGQGTVTLMLHTFVGDDEAAVKEIVREPMKRYLKSAIELIGEHAWSFPAFKRAADEKQSLQYNLSKLSPDEMDALLEFSFERYYERSGLFGTPERCLSLVDRLKGFGVDEVACLVDFGVPGDQVLGMLPALARLLEASRPVAAEQDLSIAGLVTRHQVSHLQCTPSMARMLLATDDTRAALSRLRHIMIGGEAMTEALVNDLGQATPARVSNMYGPTETTVWSSVDTVRPGEPITIGKPIANTQLYVLDGNRELVPIGTPGELYIAGDGVTRGYHARPELNATRFVPDPFSTRPGARMYRTGDLVRFRDDGRVEFLGRLDHQVKVRGYRIELGEIEALLAAAPGVREAVVIVREDRAGDPRIVAYLRMDEAQFDAAALRAALAAKLPDYMVPSAFVRMDRFPLTPNKKVDRKALPPPGEAQKRTPVDYAQPASDLEAKVSAVYQTVLGIDRIGRDDNFFELGGHSLLAVQAHRKLREALGRDLSITDIFRLPTVRALCAHLEAGAGPSARLQQSSERGSSRREALLRRRGRGTQDAS